MERRLINCFPNGKFIFNRIFGMNLIAFIGLFFFFMITGLIPLQLYSQFETDTVIVNKSIGTGGFIKGKKSIDVQIEIRAAIIKDKKIKVSIEPFYYEEGILLDVKAIKKNELSCKLIIAKIKIKPDNYCSLNSTDTVIPLSNNKAYNLDFAITKNLEPEEDLIISFPFQINAGKQKENTEGKLTLKLIEIQDDKNILEDSGVENLIEKSNTKPGTEKKEKNASSGGKPGENGGGGAGGDEKDADSISTESLEKVLGEIKAFGSEVYSANFTKEEIGITPEQVEKYKGKLESIKRKFEIHYAKFVEVPKAEGLIKSCELNLENIKDNLDALEKYLAGNENKVLSEKENQIASEKKQNKTLQIILIILGAVLLGIVLFVLMKFLMKMIKKKFEKKMKRKAALELNKQKFKVMQQKNKLKV